MPLNLCCNVLDFSEDLTEKALNLSIKQVIKYGDAYQDGIIEFKNKHFEDRSQVIFLCIYNAFIEINKTHYNTNFIV